MWLTIISVLSPFVAASLTAFLAWFAFTRQTRRNSVVQVYMDVAQATYEAERMVALKLRGHVDKESLSPAEHEEASKAFASLIGRIGKLHLVASPTTMKAVNEFYNALYEIYDGIIPAESFKGILPPALGEHLFEDEMKEADIGGQIDRFEMARIPLLRSMREDLGYSKKDLLIEHNSFTSCFYRDHIRRGKALAAAGDTTALQKK
jgi:hypothetical protein